MAIFHDVVNKKGESRLFTTNDLEQIIKGMFIDVFYYMDAINKQPASSETDVKHKEACIINRGFIGLPDKFNSIQADYITKAMANQVEDLPSLFETKVANFYSIHRESRVFDLPMFDFFWNGSSDLFLNPNGSIQIANNKNIPKNMLVIRVFLWSIRSGNPIAIHIDLNTFIDKNSGLYDAQLRYLPWFFDEWVNRDHGNIGDKRYLMSPLLHHSLKIIDKLSLLSKQKQNGTIRISLLRNAIEASLYDARIVNYMNERYQTLNGMFIRIVPAIIPSSSRNGTGQVEYVSRFFQLFPKHTEHNTYSYSDVVSTGSGTDYNNRNSIEDYDRVIHYFNLQDIVFTNEKNTNVGLFSWLNDEFAKLIIDTDSTPARVDLSVVNDHMITVDHVNKVYKTALKGELDFLFLDPKKAVIECKKFNQRFKLANSKTYLYNDADSFNNSLITKEIVGDLFFHRNVDYMKDVNTVDNYARSALVAFVSSDIELPELNDLVNSPVNKLNEFFYSLRGVSCEGFFTRNFLKQRMMAQRTEPLKLMLTETDPKFQEIVINKSKYINKNYENRYDQRDQFLIREYQNCTCGGKIINNVCKFCNNANPVDGEVYKEYWVDFQKDFVNVTIKDIKISDDGIKFYLDYFIPIGNSRLKCKELSKFIPVETSQSHVGYVTEFNCGDFHFDNVNIPLDGVYFGLGGFKSKTHGIPFTALRLYNALKNQVVYSSDDCLNKTNEVNEFLKTFKKSKIRTKMYDAKLKKYVYKTVEAWIGLVSLSPTEISQEFNKTKTETEKSFSKANYALYELLGFNDLNNAMAEANQKTVESNDIMYRKLLKITKILNAKAPFYTDTEEDQAKAVAYDNLLAGEVNFYSIYNNNAIKNTLFNAIRFEHLSSNQFITYSEYLNILRSHPLFCRKEFEKGFYLDFVISSTRKEFKRSVDVRKMDTFHYAVYFPERSVLMNMFEFIGDNDVRINDLLSAYFNVFQTLATSKFGPEGNLVSVSGKEISFNNTNGALLTACYNQLFEKDGIINKITNIAMPRVMSKQLTDHDCPFDVAIISNKHHYRRLASKYFAVKYPDREQDWSEEIDKETNSYTKLGWCWTEDMYCVAIREPNIFLKQNLNIKKVWSAPKADIEYKNLYGYSFREKHPNPRGIYLNSVFVVLCLEGDTDGDIAFLGVPSDVKTQDELAKIWEQTKDLAFFDANNPNSNAKLVRQSYLISSLSYLLDEASNLNFKLDELKIGYTEIPFDVALTANFDAAKNKSAIGFLTVSLWYITYFLDFYIYNYNYFKSKYNVPELTPEDKYDLLFIFQYLLTQQNGVRAMKDDGSYGKLTYSALIKNDALDKPARQLFYDLINDYKEMNKKHGIDVDYSVSVNKLFNIFDNLFIATFKTPSANTEFRKGFGFALDTISKANPDGNYRVISYLDKFWGNNTEHTPYGKVMQLDCNNMLDPYFLDFEAMFLVFYGRDLDKFISKFGHDPVMKILGFVNKEHLNTPLLRYYSNVFKK